MDCCSLVRTLVNRYVSATRAEPGPAQQKRASPRGEAGTSGFLSVSAQVLSLGPSVFLWSFSTQGPVTFSKGRSMLLPCSHPPPDPVAPHLTWTKT